MNALFGKLIDLAIDQIFKLFVHVFKVVSPIKIYPKIIKGGLSGDWNEILTFKIKNKLSSELYDIYIEGLSKFDFDIKIISDNGPKGKTVEYMEINTNHLVVFATDQRTGDRVWIFRIHKLEAREELNLRIKVTNQKDINFKVLQYSSVEIPIKENSKGVVEIPFKINKYQKVTIKPRGY